ncbi:unnamed protein product [Ectocarpus sp. 12 AP-2014]
MDHMNSHFRSTQDEFLEIESRWRILAAREASISQREREVRMREEEIRRFLSNAKQSNNFLNDNHITVGPPPSFHMPRAQRGQYTQQHNIKKRRAVKKDKDYASLALNNPVKSP